MNENGDLGVSHGPADPGGLAWQRFGDYDGGKPGGFVHGLPGQVGSTQGRNEMKTPVKRLVTAAALAVGAALVGSVLRFNATQLLGAVGVGVAAGAGTGIVTGLVGTAIV